MSLPVNLENPTEGRSEFGTDQIVQNRVDGRVDVKENSAGKQETVVGLDSDGTDFLLI
jgi:hypothetical protein